MATIIRVDGSKEELKDTSLKSLQNAVGGYIEILTLKNKKIMILDEEGKLKGKPINKEASLMSRGVIASEDLIVGDVVICDKKELN